MASGFPKSPAKVNCCFLLFFPQSLCQNLFSYSLVKVPSFSLINSNIKETSVHFKKNSNSPKDISLCFIIRKFKSIHVSKHQILHLKHTHFYLSIIPQKDGGKKKIRENSQETALKLSSPYAEQSAAAPDTFKHKVQLLSKVTVSAQIQRTNSAKAIVSQAHLLIPI